ncbi:hypothetical protein U9M48_021129 [Paspalum notatum var. saurae]|uniref:Uncharacterized protein n=1 Tax=Paspalum notatum var. saurae TaxID=547442 RepID=A0AAQ3TIF2_PASNO
MAAAFSIRGLVRSLRGTPGAELGPFDLAAKDLPPMEVRAFRWWEDELAAVKAAGPRARARARAAADPAREVDEEEEEVEVSGPRRAPKKRSMDDLFAAAPAVNGPSKAAAEDEEVLGDIYKRTKEMRRRRRQEEAAAASASGEEPETAAAAERRAAEANFSRKKSLEKPNFGEELDTPGPSKEHEDEHHFSMEKVPDLKRRKHGRLNNSLQKKADRLKYIESRKAVKVGKQRDIKKMLPLQSILKKKFTKHTSVKMVKEKHGRSKGPEVITWSHKSVKRVKFSEMNEAPGSKKQIYKLVISDDMMTSSSSIEMPSEEEHIIAESSSSHMPEEAFSRAKEATENTNHDNQCGLSSTGLSTHLFDLNVAPSEPSDVNNPYASNSDVTYLEHAQVATLCVDHPALDTGRSNHKDLSFNTHGQERERHGTDSDTRRECKSPYTVQDSVQLQNRCSMTMHHGASQVSTAGEPSFQFRGRNLSHCEKHNFPSDMNVQQESRPSAGQTLRLMGQDLAVSNTNTRVDFLSEAAQKHRNPTEDHPSTKVVLELPRRGQPFLSLQTQSVSNVSASSPSTVAQFSSYTSTTQAHFGYRMPHNVSHPLPTANVFSGDPSRYEDRCRDFTNLQAHRNVLLGYPPLYSHGSAAVLQNSPPSWHHYSDHSTRTNSPSVPFSTTMMQHVPPASGYRANLPQSYGVYSASSSVHPCSSVSFSWSHPDRVVQGVPDSRASAAVPSRNAGTGTARTAPVNSNTSSSSRSVLRTGPVKLSAGAKHILIPNENTGDSNSAPMYSRVSFASGGNVSAPRQNKGAGSHRF